MKMSDHQGYRVAEKVNDKGLRQVYLSMHYIWLPTLSESGVKYLKHDL